MSGLRCHGGLVLKSITEQILYVQPFLFRVAKNIYAFVADAVMLLVSLPLCVQMDKYLHSYLPDLVT